MENDYLRFQCIVPYFIMYSSGVWPSQPTGQRRGPRSTWGSDLYAALWKHLGQSQCSHTEPEPDPAKQEWPIWGSVLCLHQALAEPFPHSYIGPSLGTLQLRWPQPDHFHEAASGPSPAQLHLPQLCQHHMPVRPTDGPSTAHLACGLKNLGTTAALRKYGITVYAKV